MRSGLFVRKMDIVRFREMDINRTTAGIGMKMRMRGRRGFADQTRSEDGRR
jgi:hypothetical protein